MYSPSRPSSCSSAGTPATKTIEAESHLQSIMRDLEIAVASLENAVADEKREDGEVVSLDTSRLWY
jgi:hypothetical protein